MHCAHESMSISLSLGEWCGTHEYRRDGPNSLERHLEEIVPPERLQLVPPGIKDALLERPLESVELDHPDRAEDFVHERDAAVAGGHLCDGRAGGR